MTRSAQLFEEAKRYIPGGVNSPVRAFAAIGSCPRFIAKADGAYLTDADGNRYIDYVCSWGPMILGHNRREIREAVTEAAARGLSYGAATEIEVEMARMVCGMVPGVEMVRMVNSGTGLMNGMSSTQFAPGFPPVKLPEAEAEPPGIAEPKNLLQTLPIEPLRLLQRCLLLFR